ncbi:glycosyltransferase family 8 protein [Stieleria sp. JC731]|uniref:glycosyltransferase family 8 protein n=1 Tax=Pirellulaceae TaxID=2691357 RepID=UPI001E39AB63|nr:glycosyltransferase family 8 protein [Stieleria sp. JC731]MCC9599950.1 glycosyltransferase family 8 protein [Stieleria sp. JC731]
MTNLTVVSASDSRYLPGLFVTWGSILKFSPDVDIDFHLLHDGIASDELAELRKQLGQIRGRFTLTDHELDVSHFDGFPEFYFDSKMTYARLLIPRILDADKVLYVDTDVVMTRNVAEFQSLELGDAIVGVVKEWGYEGDLDSRLFADEFPEVLAHRYFNCGVIFMDLNRIRNEELFVRASEILTGHPKRCLYWDQSALNVVFAGKCKYLSENSNYQIKPGHEPSVATLEQLVSEGVNLHYMAKAKPWLSHQQSLSHRFFHAIRASLEGDVAAAERVRQSRPVWTACMVNWIKGVRLQTKAALRIGDIGSARRLGNEHIHQAHSLLKEAAANRRVSAMFRSI